MTPRRKAQALNLNRRKLAPVLHVVPRGVVSAAGQSVSGMRSSFLRSIDYHPALVMLTVVAIVALVCVFYLRQVTAVSNANYALHDLQTRHTQLLREREELLLQIGRAQSLSTIESAARDRLKMVPIGDQYEYLPIAPGPLRALGAAAPQAEGQPAPDTP